MARKNIKRRNGKKSRRVQRGGNNKWRISDKQNPVLKILIEEYHPNGIQEATSYINNSKGNPNYKYLMGVLRLTEEEYKKKNALLGEWSASSEQVKKEYNDNLEILSDAIEELDRNKESKKQEKLMEQMVTDVVIDQVKSGTKSSLDVAKQIARELKGKLDNCNKENIQMRGQLDRAAEQMNALYGESTGGAKKSRKRRKTTRRKPKRTNKRKLKSKKR